MTMERKGIWQNWKKGIAGTVGQEQSRVEKSRVELWGQD